MSLNNRHAEAANHLGSGGRSVGAGPDEGDDLVEEPPGDLESLGMMQFFEGAVELVPGALLDDDSTMPQVLVQHRDERTRARGQVDKAKHDRAESGAQIGVLQK